jgi:hypothetical protein
MEYVRSVGIGNPSGTTARSFLGPSILLLLSLALPMAGDKSSSPDNFGGLNIPTPTCRSAYLAAKEYQAS